MNSQSKLLFYLGIVILAYVGLAFLAPFALKNGLTNISNPIYSTYERFCHQRVERSLFIFGEKSFYTVLELKEKQYLPQTNSEGEYLEYFGHDFNGNEDVGYKVAICIRDVGLYLAFGIALVILSFMKKVTFLNKYEYLLILPIFIDVGIQIVIEMNRLDGPFLLYENNIEKRIITGILAGIGCALLLKRYLDISLTNQEKIGNI
jgi:uncharacterized membrane protein